MKYLISVGLALSIFASEPSHAKSDRDTMELLSTACNIGSSLSCYNLGIAYLKGDSVMKSTKKAFPYFQTACKNGLDDGCNAIAAMLYLGEGIKANQNRAFEIWKANCDKGIDSACTNISKTADTKRNNGSVTLSDMGVNKYLCGKSQFFECRKPK